LSLPTPRRWSRHRRGTGPSPTSRVPADRAGLAARDLGLGPVVLVRVDPAVLAGQGLEPARVGLVALGPVGLGDPANIRDLADRADRVDLDPADRAGLVDLDPADLVDLVDLAGLMDPVDWAAPVDRVVPGQAGLVDPHRADLVGLADLALAVSGRVDLAGRRLSTTRPAVHTIGRAPTSAALGTSRTASAPPVTVRRHRLLNTDGLGMTGLRQEGRRLSGTGRRRRVAGTVRHLRVAGTRTGTDRRAT
jgi:hypothetical protein